MKNKKAVRIDMTRENQGTSKHHYDKVRAVRYHFREKVSKCLMILDTDQDVEHRVTAILRLVFAFDTLVWLEGRKYTKAEATRLIDLLRKYSGNDVININIVRSLLEQGAKCEAYFDLRNALRFYESSLCYKITEENNLHYWCLNNTAYCLNHFRQYEKAEKLLRQAVELLPERYNAWKNLGVSLEHEKQFEAAAECYVKAIRLSRGEHRSVAHLESLVEKRPYLRTRTDISAVLQPGLS